MIAPSPCHQTLAESSRVPLPAALAVAPSPVIRLLACLPLPDEDQDIAGLEGSGESWLWQGLGARALTLVGLISCVAAWSPPLPTQHLCVGQALCLEFLIGNLQQQKHNSWQAPVLLPHVNVYNSFSRKEHPTPGISSFRLPICSSIPRERKEHSLQSKK